MKCTICLGSGLSNHSFLHLPTSRNQPPSSACKGCGGTGFSNSRIHSEWLRGLSIDHIGVVKSFSPARNQAQLWLHENLHVGSQLQFKGAEGLVVFELMEIKASDMPLHLALAGWLITIVVPQSVEPGTEVYRLSA